jgi:hypothetical protein
MYKECTIFKTIQIKLLSNWKNIIIIVVNSIKNHTNENLMCRAKVTNIKRNRDDTNNPKRIKKTRKRTHEKFVCPVRSKLIYSGGESRYSFHYNQSSNFNQEIPIGLQEWTFNHNSIQVLNLFPWPRDSIWFNLPKVNQG